MCDGRPYATRSRNRTRCPGLSATLCALITLASCGGGSSNTADSPPPAPAPTPVAASDAARLLEQATFGATASDIAHVQSIGIEAYIGEQLAYAPTQYTGFTYTPHTAPASCKNDASNPPDAASLCARDQYSAFARVAAFDQFAATLATWFGADSQALATVLPNLSAFSPTTLGFI